MNDKPNLRPYRTSDRTGLIDLMRAHHASQTPYFSRLVFAEQIASPYLNKVLTDLNAADGQILVIEKEERLIGYAILFLRKTNAGEVDEHPYSYAEIGELFVVADQRRRGLGKRLLLACEEKARSAGVDLLRIAVFASNVDAIRLYEASGFKGHRQEMDKPLS